MSETILISGRKSVLETTFTPPISLQSPHCIGLVDFVAYNSIPNVDKSNQKFHYGQEGKDVITIPRGAYDIDNIERFLKEKLGEKHISLKPNNNTLQCELESTFLVDFSQPNSIGRLLGFSNRILQPNQRNFSDLPVNLMSVNMVRVECNIATGSYINGETAHTIFAFSPKVPPGYKMVLSPQNVIYSRVNTQSIDRLSINIVDQDGILVDFGDEEITLRLHLKPVTQ